MVGIRVCIDRGGTFCDLIAFVPAHIHPEGKDIHEYEAFRKIVIKLLSVDHRNYKDAPTEGIRRILELATGLAHPRDLPLDTSNLELVRMGTTVATNALLERKGAPTVLLISRGFKDLLKIGNQARPNLFDLSIKKPDVLFSEVIEVPERVTLVPSCSVESSENTIKGVTGETVKILEKLDLEYMEKELLRVKALGIDSVAICLMHAYTYPQHESELEELCRSLNFTNISTSSATPMIKIVPRGNSTCADAYLTPCIKTYLLSFFSGFDRGMVESLDGKKKVKVEFMQSDGGLVPVEKFNGFKAILSGPAGGVVGYASTSWEEGGNPVIGFDMGGTSTDVSRFGGVYERVFETTTAGVTIQAPQLDIATVAAGGGSRLFFRNGMFVVGPESAGAEPGPTCYRKGGPLTVTDANLFLGRLDVDYFPKIFGKSEKEPLDYEATLHAFEKLAMEINAFDLKNTMTADQIASGFLTVANEAMCRPIRSLTQGKGFKASDHILASFGGAGGQHAFALARSLGIHMILIHRFSSILSAYGQAMADVAFEIQEPCAFVLNIDSLGSIKEKSERLIDQAQKEMTTQGFPDINIHIELYLNLRYNGTDTAIMTVKPDADWDFITSFVSNYQKEFGFTLPDRTVLVDDIRVRAVGTSIATGSSVKWTTVHQELKTLVQIPATKPSKKSMVYWMSEGRVSTPLYLLKELLAGMRVDGPALIIDDTATIAVEPHSYAIITSEHVVGYVGSGPIKDADDIIICDPIMLSVFGHRFMSIAEQMGRTLQKTAISTNIKERLDFSCALFDPSGGLVANAPHIPVHLGSMQEAVRWQLNFLGDKIKEGDVYLSNHPMAGGSHLPDISCITPVFDRGVIVFFVASRGHHADIGGITSGSMPPNSKELTQEGAAIKSFLLVKNGSFDEKGITKLLLEDPAKFEGCSGTRCIKDNISDLKAQVAANHRGITLVANLISEYGLPVVQAYMKFIQENAHHAVSELLRKTAKKYGTSLHAIDHMDDGSPIELSIKIEPTAGTAVFDFKGTGPEVYANWNAPVSVTYSAIIYSLRCLIDLDIPLNQGALGPITIKIPEGCFLNPGDTAAVVGGNVLTSQRLCDVIFKAFNACAASQGCCNNLTFGKDAKIDGNGFGYYETIAGGSGAGPTWNGTSGTQIHMTNTRITDPEILERRYPVILREFSLNEGSGGRGEYDGGNGVIREIEFLERLEVSILSERRVYQPYGMNGGEAGSCGQNILIRNTPNGPRTVNLGGKNSTMVNPGDVIRILTPGGGAWGKALKDGGSGRKAVEPVADFSFVKRATGSLGNYHDMQNSN